MERAWPRLVRMEFSPDRPGLCFLVGLDTMNGGIKPITVDILVSTVDILVSTFDIQVLKGRYLGIEGLIPRYRGGRYPGIEGVDI